MSTRCFHLPHGVTIVRWSLDNFSQRYIESTRGYVWVCQMFQVAGNGHQTQALLMLWPKGGTFSEDFSCVLYVSWLDRIASVELDTAMWCEIGPNNRIGISVATNKFYSFSTSIILRLQANELNQLVSQENVTIVCELRRVLPPELPRVRNPVPAQIYWTMDEVSNAICLVDEWRSDWIAIDGRPIECSLCLKHTSKPGCSYGGDYKLCLDVKVQELSQPAFYMFYATWAETLDGRRKSAKRSAINRFPSTFDNPISTYHFPNQIDKQLLDEFEQKESVVFRAYVKIVHELPVHFDDSNIDNEATHVQHLNGMTKIRCPIKKFLETFNNTKKEEFWISELFSIAGHEDEARACLCINPKQHLGFAVFLILVNVANDARIYLQSKTWIEKAGCAIQLDVSNVKCKHEINSKNLIGLLLKSNMYRLFQDDSDLVIHCKITRKYAPLPLPPNFVSQATTFSWNVKNFQSMLETPGHYFGPTFKFPGYEHLTGYLIFERLSEPNEYWDQSRLFLCLERISLYYEPVTFHIQFFAKTTNGSNTRKKMAVYTSHPQSLSELLCKANLFDEQQLAQIAREEDEITFICIIKPIILVKTERELGNVQKSKFTEFFLDLIAALTNRAALTF
ncbi:hypothetical protein M3Y96_00258200 [Aphelenchoides besseyi]|nr:hypothetical protein M3Y96_00258200 [Aphelenchoides besseyi]